MQTKRLNQSLKKDLIEILVNKIFNLLLIILFLSACSLNKNSKFWTSDTLEELEEKKFQKIFDDEKTLIQEFNTNVNFCLLYTSDAADES